MKVTVDVRSHLEGDAMKLALGHPALKTVSVITGLLLELPSDPARTCVLTLVQQSIQLAQLTVDDPAEVQGNGDLGRLHIGETDTEA